MPVDPTSALQQGGNTVPISPVSRSALALGLILILQACGGDSSKDSTSDPDASDGSSIDGGVTTDGATEDGATEDGATEDANVHDSGNPTDGATADATPDGHLPDGGPVDTGMPDSGSSDAAMNDSGPNDGGPNDGGSSDSGSGDGGMTDGGATDGGSAPFCATAMDGTSCTDGMVAGQCRSGACCTGCWTGSTCVAGSNLNDCGSDGDLCNDCNDSNTCTTDSCNAGSCTNTTLADGAVCDDGLFCTINDTCTSGTCTSGGPRNCSDGEECTTDSCNETSDQCDRPSVADSTPCAGGVCGSGMCLECLNNSDCDDGTTCTTDTCNSNLCDNAPVADSTMCTLSGGGTGECLSGVCAGSCVAALPETLTPSQVDHVNDMLGSSVAVDGDVLVVGVSKKDSAEFNSGSAHVYRKSGVNWVLETVLSPATGNVNQRYGEAVAVHGGTIIVGAPGDWTAAIFGGAAYAYVFDGFEWKLQQTITANDISVQDEFGASVDVYGNWAIVGSPQHDGAGSNAGAAYLFSRSSGSWAQSTKLQPALGGVRFGTAVALDQGTAAIGAPSAGSGGEVTTYTESMGSWALEDTLDGMDTASGDAFGTTLSLDQDTMAVGATGDDDNGSESGSAYIFSRSGMVWNQEDKVVASDGSSADHFGSALWIDGSTLVVGAPNHNPGSASSGGASYVFAESAGTWSQQQKLTANTPQSEDQLGTGVAVEGNLLWAGAPEYDGNDKNGGGVFHFTRSGTTWAAPTVFGAADGDAAGDQYGIAVDGKDDLLIVGAPRDDLTGGVDDGGGAYIYRRAGGTWNTEAYLAAVVSTSDQQGAAVAIDGDMAAIAVPEFGVSAGTVLVYQDLSGWIFSTHLMGSDIAIGSRYGISVDISGDTVVVGAGSGTGAVYVFVKSGSTWSQQAKLTASDAANSDSFGESLQIDGDTLIVGARRNDDNGASSGSAYVYTRTGSTWTEQSKLLASDAAAGDEFGTAVSVDGNVAVVGAPKDDDGGTDQGSVYLFIRSGSIWTQDAKITASDSATHTGMLFGDSLALLGTTLLVGSPNADTGSNTDNGAVYYYKNDGMSWNEEFVTTEGKAQSGDKLGSSITVTTDWFAAGIPFRADPYFNTGAVLTALHRCP